MHEQFPFLSNPTSQEYIKAQASAEGSWIETKGDLYDPILSIRVEQSVDLAHIYDPESDSDMSASISSDAEDFDEEDSDEDTS